MLEANLHAEPPGVREQKVDAAAAQRRLRRHVAARKGASLQRDAFVLPAHADRLESVERGEGALAEDAHELGLRPPAARGERLRDELLDAVLDAERALSLRIHGVEVSAREPGVAARARELLDDEHAARARLPCGDGARRAGPARAGDEDVDRFVPARGHAGARPVGRKGEKPRAERGALEKTASGGRHGGRRAASKAPYVSYDNINITSYDNMNVTF